MCWECAHACSAHWGQGSCSPGSLGAAQRWCWELNSGPPQQQYKLLTSEPPLQTLIHPFYPSFLDFFFIHLEVINISGDKPEGPCLKLLLVVWEDRILCNELWSFSLRHLPTIKVFSSQGPTPSRTEPQLLTCHQWALLALLCAGEQCTLSKLLIYLATCNPFFSSVVFALCYSCV